jgi:hypothetical protein
MLPVTETENDPVVVVHACKPSCSGGDWEERCSRQAWVKKLARPHINQ